MTLTDATIRLPPPPPLPRGPQHSGGARERGAEGNHRPSEGIVALQAAPRPSPGPSQCQRGGASLTYIPNPPIASPRRYTVQPITYEFEL